MSQQKVESPLFQQGLKDGLPICLGYISVAFTFGMMATEGGLAPWSSLLISMTNLTSAGQFAGTALILSGGTLLEIAEKGADRPLSGGADPDPLRGLGPRHSAGRHGYRGFAPFREKRPGDRHLRDVYRHHYSPEPGGEARSGHRGAGGGPKLFVLLHTRPKSNFQRVGHHYLRGYRGGDYGAALSCG